MTKYFVAVVVLVVTLASLPAKTQAQTYGGSNYGDPSGYGNNAYLNAAMTGRYGHKARPSRSSHRKQHTRRNSRSRRRSRRS